MPEKAKMNVVYFVVGDKKLNSGNGIYVKSLEEMKESLINIKQASEWRLVISIHGAEDVIAIQGGSLKKRDVEGVYDAKKISKLFNDDNNFKEWREAYGPTWTTLNACQVHKAFEAVVLKAFNKPSATQSAQGLGNNCRPRTQIMQVMDKNGNPITTRDQMKGWKDDDQLDEFNKALKSLNDKYGYFGGPPVPDTLLHRYYFDEAPKGGWPKVTVTVGRGAEGDIGINFYNRATTPENNRKLLDNCPVHMGPILRSRTSAVPPIGDI